MKVVTFGEIMLRLKTPEHLRIIQTDSFEASYGGAEANVAVSLAMMNDPVSFVTKLPDNPVGMAALNEVRRFGVDTSKVLHGGERLGTYFFEKGCNIRPTNVVYDRKYSALSMADASEFDWKTILKDADIFYFSGVTPAVSDQMCTSRRTSINILPRSWPSGCLRSELPFQNVEYRESSEGDAQADEVCHIVHCQ